MINQEHGWLKKQIDQTISDMETWPAWLKALADIDIKEFSHRYDTEYTNTKKG